MTDLCRLPFASLSAVLPAAGQPLPAAVVRLVGKFPMVGRNFSNVWKICAHLRNLRMPFPAFGTAVSFRAHSRDSRSKNEVDFPMFGMMGKNLQEGGSDD